jgi:hypothetical protein
VSSINAKLHGIPFRELSFGVFVSRREGSATQEGVYLVRAFNSVRFFAFVDSAGAGYFSIDFAARSKMVDSAP